MTLKLIMILIADDQAVVREGLAAILNRRGDFRVVGEAPNGKEAVRLYHALRPDIVLMDIVMPAMDGIQAIAAIRGEFPDAKIIILTNYLNDEDIYRAFTAGARSYLLKEASEEAIVRCVYAVYNNERNVPPAIAARLAERLTEENLTPREKEVLDLLSTGISNVEIAEKLEIACRTVKTHVKSILAKLNAKNRTQALYAAHKRGLISPK